MTPDMLSRAAELRAHHTPFVLATVVASYPPQSVRAGAKAIVLADGTIEGWVGGGCVRPVVLQEAREALAAGTPRLVRMNAGAVRDGRQAGVHVYPMTCQGEGGVEIYLEPVQPAPHIVVLGQTPVARAIARLSTALEMDVTLADEPAAALAGAGPATSVVVATMGAGDEDALAAAAQSGAAYVGLVASRKKARFLIDFVQATGVSAESLARVKAPAGIDLGGMTAPEIALSIVAEIVQKRNETLGHAEEAQRPTDLLSLPRSQPPTAGEQILRFAEDDRRDGVVDPICGMPVDPASAKHTLVDEGRTLYFCCPHCKAAYAKAHA